jgi:hypothetical protein
LRRLSKKRWLLAAAAVAALAAAAVAYGQIPGQDGTISTCYTKSTGAIRVIDSAALCGKGETSLSWNQRGPAGPPGPAGATGQTGATGQAGPPGQTGATGQAGPPGQTGATGPQGSTGATGPKGDPGPPGASLTATPLAAGDPRCNGNGGLEVSIQGGAALGVLCNGAHGANGTNGATGATGPKGDPGTPGSALVGSACTIPGGGAGIVQMDVAPTGAISFKCQDFSSDPANCGSAGHAIPADGFMHANWACVAGHEAIANCVAGFGDANTDPVDGCEVNLNTDPANCGSVGTVIPPPGTNHATYACVNGQVAITSCDAHFADANINPADGCEANLNTDPANCGSVGTAIPPPGTNHADYACVAGVVTIASCNSFFADVNHSVGDGCEVNLMTNPQHCGSVGHAIPSPGTLHANWACAGGTAVITSCVTGWANANGSVVDGCETQTDPDPSGNTQATAINLGSQDCFDSDTTTINGSIVSTLDDDWYFVNAIGSFFCQNDFGSFWSAPPTTAYDVITDRTSRFNVFTGFTAPSGFYSSGTNVLIHVHQDGNLNSFDTYHLDFHL